MAKAFKPTWLYLKQHNKTGLKYFGKTVRDPRAQQSCPRLGRKHSPETIEKIKAARKLQRNVRGVISV